MGATFSAHLNKQVTHLVTNRIINSPKYIVPEWPALGTSATIVGGKKVGHPGGPARLCGGLLESIALGSR